MRFVDIEEQLNNETSMKVIDSILNVGFLATLVIDKDTNEILYQNRKSIEYFGDHVGDLCHEVLCSEEEPCSNCILPNMTGSNAIFDVYMKRLDKHVRWMYSDINWFDGRNAVYAKLVELGDEDITSDAKWKYLKDMDKERQDTDSLTHLPNSKKFYKIAEELLRSDLSGSYAVVMFDIERFKSINDIYGMSTGDDVLIHIARVLKDCLGTEGNYARMHSDLFAYIIKYETKGDIIKQIEKFRKKVSQNAFIFDINISFGIYLIQDRQVPVNLMCDRAMMAVKTIKGDVLKFCAFFDEQYRADMLKANEIEREMQESLRRGDFKMYLQPKYRLSDTRLVGAEALCRWVHPRKGIIPPMDFIPLFERNGFIMKLDEYMWEQACKTLRGWIDAGKNPIPISVNISRYHIKHNDLVAAFSRLIKKYDISSSMLTLELTESLFLDNPEALNRVMKGLQNMGFKLEVDDFGAGFSSLNMIRNISVDTIKIDKDFLDNEIATEKGKIVVHHTIDMAKDLNLQVIAEGVETKEHVDFLKSSRCDVAQGYYFAKPMPLEEFDKLIS
ncbi:MAG: bifunctional diguanylate cyclase/phosphodiesterase [Lachnospiraceae bacterium]|nr:bifunctional diguanylate cyclase/phosphodiesterase [Lachnospiraceae bacterium]MBQ8318351.1 bifunctional diguanylate cyclase/phosphodiesterase [Lachnospiraceae bacterium]